MGQNQKLCRGKVAPPRPPRTKIKHFHGQLSEDIEAGLGKKLNRRDKLSMICIEI